MNNKISKIIKSLPTPDSIKIKLMKADTIVQIPIELINRTTEPFVSLNPVDEGQRERLKASMLKHGFLDTNPVTVWRRVQNNKYTLILTEGFSRIAVAESIGLTQIYATIKDYESIKEAEMSARQQQYARRMSTQQDMIRHFEELNYDELKKEPGRLNEKIAKQLNISPKTAQKLIKVKNSNNNIVMEKLRNGEITPDRAFQAVAKTNSEKQSKKISAHDKGFLDGIAFIEAEIEKNVPVSIALEKAKSSIAI